MIDIELHRWYYWTYLAHRCLYYKHFKPVMTDYDFDQFERAVLQEIGDIEMVDWEPRLLRAAGTIDAMSIERVLEIAKQPRPVGGK